MKQRRGRKPSGCIETKPTRQSIFIGGRYINLNAIARAQGIDHSFLSRIFRGERNCSIEYAYKIASSIGMGLEEFLEARQERIEAIRSHTESQLISYYERIAGEDLIDTEQINKDKPVIPHLPGLRVNTAK